MIGSMSAAPEVLILGCGFTGRRVAARLLALGASVTATTREPARLAGLGVNVILLEQVREHLRPGMLVVHSVPPGGPTDLIERLGDAPRRVVYISSTAVYGRADTVDANTPVDRENEKARTRLWEEERVAEGPWNTLILRPAAIYGPGRGAHESVRRGAYLAGDNYVSRIHVDDLAAHVEAGLFSEVTGAYPVADEEPCTSREIAEFCVRLLGVPMPENGSGRATVDRRVDGLAIRQMLGIELKYPSYRVGIPASLPGTQLRSRNQ
jgi:nucleoside-diphosphate-sugar epimerase